MLPLGTSFTSSTKLPQASPTQWAALRELKELQATVLRAADGGWVTLQGVGGRFVERNVALTVDERFLARRGR
jgi:hypothetical protein